MNMVLLTNYDKDIYEELFGTVMMKLMMFLMTISTRDAVLHSGKMTAF